jgi:hypothetical protein
VCSARRDREDAGPRCHSLALATTRAYQPAQDVVTDLMGCNRCTAPILMLIHAQPGHNLEDYARDMLSFV